MKSAFKLFARGFAFLLAVGVPAPATFAAFAQTGSVFSDPPKSYQLTTGWFQGRQTHYYDFGSNSATAANASKVVPAPIFVFATGMDAQGNPQVVQGQHNVIDFV